jgi:hypothetical protein
MTSIPLVSRPAARRLLVTSVAFAALYTLCNQFTGMRLDIGDGLLEWDRAIPFVPWTVLPYLSIFGFFALSFFVGSRAALDLYVQRLRVNLLLSLAAYMLFPLRFQFARPELDGVFGALFDLLTLCDLPYNRAPSLHISVLLLLWLRLAPCVTGATRLALHVWFALIGVSVLTTYQHHLIDVPAGFAVGLASIALTSPRIAALARRAFSLRTA